MPSGIFHTRSVFHSIAISLAVGKFHWKKHRQSRCFFLGRGSKTWKASPSCAWRIPSSVIKLPCCHSSTALRYAPCIVRRTRSRPHTFTRFWKQCQLSKTVQVVPATPPFVALGLWCSPKFSIKLIPKCRKNSEN